MTDPATLFADSWEARVEAALSPLGLSLRDVEIDLCDVRVGREIYGDEYVDRWDHDRSDGVWIEMVESLSSTRGVGRAVMAALGRLADDTGTHLMLCPISCARDDGTHLGQADLEAWYRRLGYQPVHPGPGSSMRRPPGAAIAA